jgi:NAD(P)-dependent dehydrogenase (short-subunit alcohol dehydrogenase family)
MSGNSEQKNWLITGCSTGFGRALAEKALARGDRVAVTARRTESISGLCAQYPETALCLALDVTDSDSVGKAVDAAFSAFDRIDVLVNNAGYGIQGAVEEVSEEQIRQLFEVNVFGVLNVIRAALPTLREQGAGHIVNVTSVGGRTSAPLISLYSSTKFAVEGLSTGLAMELAPFGIKVTAVEPGAFATNFAKRVEQPANRIAAYDPTHDQINAMLADFEYADPTGCAELMLRVVDDPDPPKQIVAGAFAWSVIEQTLQSQAGELRKWREASEAADKN